MTLFRQPLVVIAAVILAFIAGLALFAPFVGSGDPIDTCLERKLEGPSAEHRLGTDHLGRDVLSRLAFGARTSLGAVSVILAMILVASTAAGCVAALCGGIVDSVLMRLCDTFLTFPTIILAMFLTGILGTGIVNVIIAVVLTHWAWYARIIRSLVLSVKNREYVTAAKVSGTTGIRTVFRHILPATAAQLVVLATLDIGHMMLHVSGLSFLGLGVRPPLPEWGVMINDARPYLWTQPHLILYPGLLIFLTVAAFNLLGDALRDSLDVASTGGNP